MSGEQEAATPAERMRRRIMATFAERPGEQLTPTFLADELGEEFGRVVYNVRVLEGDGELEAIDDDEGPVGRAYRLPAEH